MYCYNCGKFFPDQDAVQRRDGETALHLLCCPHCWAADLGESEECEICGKEFPEGETSHGFCLCCLWEAIDYDVALEFIKYDRYGGLAQFILNDWFGASFEEGAIQGGSSDALNAFLEETFRRLVADEKLRCAMCKLEEARFLEACRLFCLPYYPSGDFGLEGQQFAEWYARRKKEGGEK